jgi:hypothetical protein
MVIVNVMYGRFDMRTDMARDMVLAKAMESHTVCGVAATRHTSAITRALIAIAATKGIDAGVMQIGNGWIVTINGGTHGLPKDSRQSAHYALAEVIAHW